MQSYIIAIIISSILSLYPANLMSPVELVKTVETKHGIVRVAGAENFHALKVNVTAYSSSPDETDDTPFITASNTEVRDGVMATNLLPFGTKVVIPELFGSKVFTVEDRMHRRKTDFVDIWMPSKQLAKEFGIHKTEILVLE